MTPKEKAKELRDKMYLKIPSVYDPTGLPHYPIAKEMALIAVDEIIASLGRLNVEILHIGVDFSHLITELRSNYNSHVIWWNKVKQEIELL